MNITADRAHQFAEYSDRGTYTVHLVDGFLVLTLDHDTDGGEVFTYALDRRTDLDPNSEGHIMVGGQPDDLVHYGHDLDGHFASIMAEDTDAETGDAEMVVWLEGHAFTATPAAADVVVTVDLSPEPTERAVVKVDARRTTYLGARALVVEFQHDTDPVGLRTVYLEWLDAADPRNGGHPAGTVVRSVIKGDGRYAAGNQPWRFQQIERAHVVPSLPASDSKAV